MAERRPWWPGRWFGVAILGCCALLSDGPAAAQGPTRDVAPGRRQDYRPVEASSKFVMQMLVARCFRCSLIERSQERVLVLLIRDPWPSDLPDLFTYLASDTPHAWASAKALDRYGIRGRTCAPGAVGDSRRVGLFSALPG